MQLEIKEENILQTDSWWDRRQRTNRQRAGVVVAVHNRGVTVTSQGMPATITNPPATNAASSATSASGGSANSTSSQLVIPASAPAGSIVITQPPQTATSYFKLAPSQTVTIAWNFTDVIVTPTSLTVSAVCDNGNTYPVGPTNGIIPGSATSVTWDLYSYQQANPATQLVQGTYTLMIWGNGGPNAQLSPGQLAPNDNLRFAIYTPQAYTPLASGEFFPPRSCVLTHLASLGWQCAICSGSLSSYTSHPAFTGILTLFIVMFLSGFSVLRYGVVRRR